MDEVADRMTLEGQTGLDRMYILKQKKSRRTVSKFSLVNHEKLYSNDFPTNIECLHCDKGKKIPLTVKMHPVKFDERTTERNISTDVFQLFILKLKLIDVDNNQRRMQCEHEEFNSEKFIPYENNAGGCGSNDAIRAVLNFSSLLIKQRSIFTNVTGEHITTKQSLNVKIEMPVEKRMTLLHSQMKIITISYQNMTSKLKGIHFLGEAKRKISHIKYKHEKSNSVLKRNYSEQIAMCNRCFICTGKFSKMSTNNCKNIKMIPCMCYKLKKYFADLNRTTSNNMVSCCKEFNKILFIFLLIRFYMYIVKQLLARPDELEKQSDCKYVSNWNCVQKVIREIAGVGIRKLLVDDQGMLCFNIIRKEHSLNTFATLISFINSTITGCVLMGIDDLKMKCYCCGMSKADGISKIDSHRDYCVGHNYVVYYKKQKNQQKKQKKRPKIDFTFRGEGVDYNFTCQPNTSGDCVTFNCDIPDLCPQTITKKLTDQNSMRVRTAAGPCGSKKDKCAKYNSGCGNPNCTEVNPCGQCPSNQSCTSQGSKKKCCGRKKRKKTKISKKDKRCTEGVAKKRSKDSTGSKKSCKSIDSCNDLCCDSTGSVRSKCSNKAKKKKRKRCCAKKKPKKNCCQKTPSETSCKSSLCSVTTSPSSQSCFCITTDGREVQIKPCKPANSCTSRFFTKLKSSFSSFNSQRKCKPKKDPCIQCVTGKFRVTADYRCGKIDIDVDRKSRKKLMCVLNKFGAKG